MKQNSSTDSSTFQPLGPDAISRRAYELWEKEGRPEGNDLRHWLQAEQDLRSTQSGNDLGSASDSSLPRNTSIDTRPLQGTRAAAALNRESKRSANAPFSSGKGETNGNSQAARRKPPSAPPL
jgi:hypothetical protein